MFASCTPTTTETLETISEIKKIIQFAKIGILIDRSPYENPIPKPSRLNEAANSTACINTKYHLKYNFISIYGLTAKMFRPKKLSIICPSSKYTINKYS